MTGTAAHPRPLDGIRVLDFTHVMAGPFSTNYLSQLGARVTKIESLGGDVFRYYGEDRALKDAGMGAAFVGANAGKESIALDLTHQRARDIVTRLVGSTDVLVENFRPGSIERLGFDYDSCAKIRPDLIYCSISGFGQTGPMRDYPAIDNIVQAMSGLMSVSGAPDSDEPIRIGVPAVDTFAATTAALAILAAIVARERFGGGQRIDVSMLDSALVFLYGTATPYLVSGTVPRKTGNAGYSGSQAAGVFACSDGRLVSIGAVQDSQVHRLIDFVQHPEFTRERFGTMALRLESGSDLAGVLRKVLATRPAAEWERELTAINVPCGVVRTVPEALDLPQVAERGLIESAALADLGRPDARILGSGYLFDHGGPRVGGRAPRLGEHTRAILGDLGYSEKEIEELEVEGIVGAP